MQKINSEKFRICRKKSDRTFGCKIALSHLLHQHTKIGKYKLRTIYAKTKFRNNCCCKTQGSDKGDNKIGVSVT
jgi:hypothetical protein